MDVISAHQRGIGFALAPLGTAFSHEHASFAKRYSKDIVVMFDSDSAGQTAALKAGEIFMESGLYVKIVLLPDGLDPDDFLIKYGADEFKKQLDIAGDIVDFKLKLYLHSKKSPRDLPAQEKSKIAKIILETVSKQSDGIIKNEWTKTIAEKLHIPQETVLSELKKINHEKKEKYPVNEEKSALDKISNLEFDFIHIFLKNPSLISYAVQIDEDNLQSDFAKKILTMIRNMSGENPRSIINKLVETYPAYAAQISKLSNQEIINDFNPENVIAASVAKLLRASKERRRQSLYKNISKLTPKELLEFKELTQELKPKTAN
ncbi:MAG: toprim domain-containing protein [Elusimicrobia bacterium]|nr:toprim domain-containing protein [Elusimicrobiota bacterium]